jgi:hypothetical protein
MSFTRKNKLIEKVFSMFVSQNLVKDPSLPDWTAFIEKESRFWRERLDLTRGGQRILIANNLPGFHVATILESMLAVALTLRGAEVHTLICDRVLSACLNLKIRAIPHLSAVEDGSWKDAPSACEKCNKSKSAFLGLGLPIHYYSQYLTETEKEEIARLGANVPVAEIPGYHHQGIAIGEHAYAGCLRYFSTGNLDGQEKSDFVLRKYFEAALQTMAVTNHLIERYKFDVACFHHGIYVPQGIVGEVCRARGVRVVNWNPAYRKRCFIFSHGDTYHHTLMDEPVSHWKEMTYTDKQDAEIWDYLKSRWSGSQDWIWFHDTPDDKDETLIRETGIDLNKPVIGLLTNVMWDAQLHYRANAFPNMLDWILKTIRYFQGRPDLQLLIRVHPAEIRGTQPSRQMIIDEIKKVFPGLPKNVFIIPPQSDINTYSAMAKCNSVIIYGTKTGVELTSMGIPVIVAGEAWIRNKDLTIDVSSEQDYYRILQSLPLKESRMSEEKIHEARKYAYHFFLRRMIPISSVEPTQGKIPFRVSISSIKDLKDGVDPGLDVICDGILHGKPFIYQSELI